MLRYEWHRLKAAKNLKKHGVSFDEASTLFCDPLACIFDDEEHSEGDVREIIIGHSATGRLMIVSFTETKPGCIRIISARQVTNKEREDYEENRH